MEKKGTWRRAPRAVRRRAVVALAGLAAAAPLAMGAPLTDEPIAPIPLSVEVVPGRATLGKRLFNETRLSRDNSQSCATCHPLDRGGVDGLPRAPSASASAILRNTPTVFNVAFNLSFNWDGGPPTLEAEAEGVIRSPAQFNNTWPTLLETLRGDSGYVAAFKAAYPDGVTRENVLDAVATYERTLITPNSRFDKYLRGDRDAITPAEQRGYELFKAFGCSACHQGVNVGGNLYQKFGVFRQARSSLRDSEAIDQGRFRITGRERDREVFRVPSLRNVELTAPYFHDGSAATLEEAVRTMARVQLDRSLAPAEADAIVQFLRTLTGEFDGRPLTPSATPPEKKDMPNK